MQVLQVKAVIEETNPEFPAAQLKLIHSGQILKDDSTLAEYKIKEDEFLVCMVTKVRRRTFERNACYFIISTIAMHDCLTGGVMKRRLDGGICQRLGHIQPLSLTW